MSPAMTPKQAISAICSAQIQRSSNLSCARSAKRDGDLKEMQAFVRAARRWHAKARRVAAVTPADALAHFFGDRVLPGAAA